MTELTVYERLELMMEEAWAAGHAAGMADGLVLGAETSEATSYHMSTSWRQTPSGYEHKCDHLIPQAGYFSANRFGSLWCCSCCGEVVEVPDFESGADALAEPDDDGSGSLRA
jgi:hypothetical protein